MKFTDGYWGIRSDVTAHYPIHVHEVAAGARELVYYGPTKRLTTRGDTLNTPVITVRLSSPLENVIRVQIWRHQGVVQRGPDFAVATSDDHTVEVSDTAETATLTSGRLRGGLSLSLCGLNFWSHDMGGFEQTASADVYKRWCAFGLLSSHSRLHGASSYRVPWLFDDEAVEVLRRFVNLKCRLMPYLYQAAVEAHRSGVPTMRAMVLEFPDDPATHTLDRQYVLGPSLLVAPVMAADGKVDYYLPAGRWTQLLTGEVREGGRWQHDQCGFMELPLFARPNSLVALGANDQVPDYNYAEQVTLHLFELGEGCAAETVVPALDGTPALTVRAERQGDRITIHASGDTRDWRVLLRGVRSVRAVENGEIQETPLGMLVCAEARAQQMILHL